VPIKKNTIPHEILGEYKSASVLLKPAAPGTGIIAGGPVRAVMEAVGIKDILAKSLGSKNTMNIVKGVFTGLENMFDAKKVAQDRNKTIQELWG
jgi:small subunit ribosomal protein S5